MAKKVRSERPAGTERTAPRTDGAALQLAEEEALGGADAVEAVEGEEEARGASASGQVGERLDDGGLAVGRRPEELADLGGVELGAGPGAHGRRDAGEGEDAERVEGLGEGAHEAGGRPGLGDVDEREGASGLLRHLDRGAAGAALGVAVEDDGAPLGHARERFEEAGLADALGRRPGACGARRRRGRPARRGGGRCRRGRGR